jgi:hypothetical protein
MLSINWIDYEAKLQPAGAEMVAENSEEKNWWNSRFFRREAGFSLD